MNSRFNRLARRWQVAHTFSAAGSSWSDQVALWWAGIARLRPFAGESIYAQAGRAIRREVTPRLHQAGGARVHLDLTEQIDLIVFEEIFLEGIYPLQDVPFTPDLIIDCGACAGLFTLLAHGRFPAARLHLFEPEPGNLVRLRRNLSTNGIAADVHAAAVGVQNGHAQFSGQGFGGHLTAAAASETIEVDVIDFPEFLRERAEASLVLKIDIEGAEAELLPALAPVLPSCTALFLETHQTESEWQTYLQPLFQSGFSRQEIRRRPGENPGTEYVEHLLLRNQ